MVGCAAGDAGKFSVVESPLDRLEVVVQRLIELFLQAAAHEKVDETRVNQHGRCDRGRIPDGKADAQVEGMPPADHGSSVRTRKPTPRIV